MKQSLGTYLGASSLVILVAYIIFNESTKEQWGQTVKPPEIETLAQESQVIQYDIPEQMTFAGEEVPLYIPEVMERLAREVQINTYWHNHSITLIKRANRWLPVIEEVLKENSVPEDFKYLSVIESDLSNAVSPAKAVGYWQFLRGTAREFGLEVTREVDERYHPVKSTEAACRYLNKSYNLFQNWTLVAAAYNRGRTGIMREINSQKEDSYYDLRLNSETSRYVFRILAARELLTKPESYGFHIKESDLLTPINYREIEVSESIPSLVDFAKQQGVTYKQLKDFNPWLRSNKLTVSRGKKYTLWLPVS